MIQLEPTPAINHLLAHKEHPFEILLIQFDENYSTGKLMNFNPSLALFEVNLSHEEGGKCSAY